MISAFMLHVTNRLLINFTPYDYMASDAACNLISSDYSTKMSLTVEVWFAPSQKELDGLDLGQGAMLIMFQNVAVSPVVQARATLLIPKATMSLVITGQ